MDEQINFLHQCSFLSFDLNKEQEDVQLYIWILVTFRYSRGIFITSQLLCVKQKRIFPAAGIFFLPFYCHRSKLPIRTFVTVERVNAWRQKALWSKSAIYCALAKKNKMFVYMSLQHGISITLNSIEQFEIWTGDIFCTSYYSVLVQLFRFFCVSTDVMKEPENEHSWVP